MPPKSISTGLIATADAAIGQSLSRGAPFSVSAPRTEPGLVAAVAIHAVPKMARDWRVLAAPHGLRIELSCVFTHKSPEVRFNSPIKTNGTCELADLLLVVDDCRRKTRRAVLIQAKMASQRGNVSISGLQNRLQLDLFQNWHPFSFKEPIYKLSGIDFNSNGSAAGMGLYGIIDRHWNRPPRTPSWKQLDPMAVPGATQNAPTLAEFIVAMLYGRAGRDATLGAQPTDFAKTVHALMTMTFQNRFHDRRSLGPAAFPRGNTTMAFLFQGSLLQQITMTDGNLQEDTAPEVIEVDREPANSAISVLRIAVS